MEYCKDCRFYVNGECICHGESVSPYDKKCADFEEV